MSFESPRFPEPPDEGGGLGDSAADDDEDPLASPDCGDDVGPGCFPRPPEFGVPPPPLPPGLCSSVASGRRSGASSSDELQFCEVRPVGAELTTPSAFPSLPVIAVCSSVVLVAVLVASFLLWKHKKKVQNFLPCKSPHQGGVPCDLSAANGAAYSDILLNHHHPTRLPAHLVHGTDTHTLTPIELLDVKYGSYGAPHLAPLTQTNYTFRPTSLRPQDHSAQHRTPQHATLHGHHAGSTGSGRRSAPGTSQRSSHKASSNSRTASSRRSHRGGNSEQFNPIYEEVSGRSKSRRGGYRHHDSEDSEEDEARSLGSEDEFAEDELSLGEYPRPAESASSSLQGSTGGDLCPPDAEPRSSGNRRPKARTKHSHSLERNRNNATGLQAKHNYYLSKSALAFDQRNPGPYSSVDLMQHPHQDSSPPEPAPGAANFGAASQAGFMMGPDCQYPPAPNAPFSTFLLQPCGAVQEDNAAEGDAENIYASIDDDEVAAGPYTIGGARVAAKTGQGARTVAKEASVVPSYGDIRPVFPTDQSGRTLCT
ncbi:uncharacterized protein LOC119401275 [Rhipicephalus sanguineus]|uniref:uncharacterized protein LOC119401275 n=1 Tax=Rhipicephalus sanguineus TaxID=34632 RepID=UPI001895E871|nr:uncharacterized protein LOC119401275 [Rhipicephalus sanguineus]